MDLFATFLFDTPELDPTSATPIDAGSGGVVTWHGYCVVV